MARYMEVLLRNPILIFLTPLKLVYHCIVKKVLHCDWQSYYFWMVIMYSHCF